MHDCGKSDSPILPVKSANNGTDNKVSAERMEGRGVAKENAQEQNRLRTQCRECLQSELGRIRQIAATDKDAKFTTLWHHVYDTDRLREAFYGLKRNSAKGVDGETWEHYGENLEENLTDLSDRLKRGAYHAKPVRRVYIPKPDGRQRPIGVPALEDKIVQSATAEVLNAIYEADFKDFSFGFRQGRSQHDALDRLAVGIERGKVSWVLDIDLRSFFDTIDHGWMMKFIEHRIADKRVLRHIKKWLNAGVLEDGKIWQADYGTPQGGSISPLLANIYLHYVLDIWASIWKRNSARGEMLMVRFADDAIFGFQYKSDAEGFQEEMKKRLSRFHLELNAEKTRLIEFGRFAAVNRAKRGDGKPETFDFQGFTHICGKRRKDGGFVLIRKTMAKRLRARLRKIWLALKKVRYKPIMEQGQWLQSVVRGYLNYHAVPGNNRAINSFRYQVKRYWLQALRGRSQKHRMTWDRFERLEERWLPRPTILHPYPNVRFHALHPR